MRFIRAGSVAQQYEYKRNETVDSDNLRIGRQIRDFRKAKGVTLAEMV